MNKNDYSSFLPNQDKNINRYSMAPKYYNLKNDNKEEIPHDKNRFTVDYGMIPKKNPSSYQFLIDYEKNKTNKDNKVNIKIK